MIASNFGNSKSNLTGSRFEFYSSRSRDERVTAQPTGLIWLFVLNFEAIGHLTSILKPENRSESLAFSKIGLI